MGFPDWRATRCPIHSATGGYKDHPRDAPFRALPHHVQRLTHRCVNAQAGVPLATRRGGRTGQIKEHVRIPEY